MQVTSSHSSVEKMVCFYLSFWNDIWYWEPLILWLRVDCPEYSWLGIEQWERLPDAEDILNPDSVLDIILKFGLQPIRLQEWVKVHFS